MTTVYTASMGGYDSVPPPTSPHPDIRYICFTDGLAKVAEPWEHRRVQRLFDDPTVDAKRIKLLPHLFIPDDDISLWIDANVELHDVGPFDIATWLCDRSIATMRNRQFDCAYEEGEFLAAWRYDDPAAILTQLADFRAAGFPNHAGLPALGLVARRHWNPTVVRHSNEWWRSFVNYHRRDQPSFAFAAWSVGVEPALLDIDYTDNRWFTWGEDGLGLHERPRPSAEIRAGQGFRPRGVRPPASSPHTPIEWSEPWHEGLLNQLATLGETIRSTGEPMGGNICYFDGEPDFTWSPPDPRRSAARGILRRATADRRRLVAVGFGAGHAATFLLSFNSQLRCTAVDPGTTHFSKATAELVGQWFTDRFEIFWGDSCGVLPCLDSQLGEADIVMIDGWSGTRTFSSAAVAHIIDVAQSGTRIVVDGMLINEVAGVIHHQIGIGRLSEVWPSPTSEIGIFETIA